MAQDIVTTLSEELAAKTLTIGLLEQALHDERATATNLRADLAGTTEQVTVLVAECNTAYAEIDRLANTLQTAVQGNGRPVVQSAQSEPRTATDYIARLAKATGTAESTVRGNLTFSQAFYDLRHESEGIDSIPLTQSSLWLCWLCETVSDHMGHSRTRYEQLLRHHVSLNQLLTA